MAKQLKFTLGGTLRIIEDDAGCVRVITRYDGFIVTSEGDYVMYAMPVLHALSVQVKYVDAGGNDAAVDGDVDWATSDSNVVAIEVDGDDTTMAVITTKDKTGTARVTATADADLGEGTRELVTIFDVQVIAGEAVAGTITPQDEPEPIGPQPVR